ncbi:hypothetical protein HK107_06705 [Parvularcula sp. ZS-1/3]|uniref:Uncharacterized protein n=1 Tax=Parvularcula mediterranea TaxID=2732508 RepID=A0A7Y3RL01_9PROT|nr:hypothetical protein [Parvularcula mediterranea]NNU16009.1 hypothetical protein [Parvularcula mediterranea]
MSLLLADGVEAVEARSMPGGNPDLAMAPGTGLFRFSHADAGSPRCAWFDGLKKRLNDILNVRIDLPVPRGKCLTAEKIDAFSTDFLWERETEDAILVQGDERVAVRPEIEKVTNVETGEIVGLTRVFTMYLGTDRLSFGMGPESGVAQLKCQGELRPRQMVDAMTTP